MGWPRISRRGFPPKADARDDSGCHESRQRHTRDEHRHPIATNELLSAVEPSRRPGPHGLTLLHHAQGNVAVGDAVDVMMFDGAI